MTTLLKITANLSSETPRFFLGGMKETTHTWFVPLKLAVWLPVLAAGRKLHLQWLTADWEFNLYGQQHSSFWALEETSGDQLNESGWCAVGGSQAVAVAGILEIILVPFVYGTFERLSLFSVTTGREVSGTPAQTGSEKHFSQLCTTGAMSTRFLLPLHSLAFEESTVHITRKLHSIFAQERMPCHLPSSDTSGAWLFEISCFFEQVFALLLSSPVHWSTAHKQPVLGSSLPKFT